MSNCKVLSAKRQRKLGLIAMQRDFSMCMIRQKSSSDAGRESAALPIKAENETAAVLNSA
jgi:hypothetical protein